MKFHQEIIPERIAHLGKNVFGVNTPEDTIKAFEDFFSKIECPIRLSEMNIPNISNQEILAVMEQNEISGNEYELNNEDYPKLLALFE